LDSSVLFQARDESILLGGPIHFADPPVKLGEAPMNRFVVRNELGGSLQEWSSPVVELPGHQEFGLVDQSGYKIGGHREGLVEHHFGSVKLSLLDGTGGKPDQRLGAVGAELLTGPKFGLGFGHLGVVQKAVDPLDSNLEVVGVLLEKGLEIGLGVPPFSGFPRRPGASQEGVALPRIMLQPFRVTQDRSLPAFGPGVSFRQGSENFPIVGMLVEHPEQRAFRSGKVPTGEDQGELPATFLDRQPEFDGPLEGLFGLVDPPEPSGDLDP